MALPLLSLIPNFISGLWSLGSDFIKYKQEITQAKHEITLQKIKASADWEMGKITEVGNSWKDEFWTIVLAVPAILIMVAPVVELILYHNDYHKGDFIAAVMNGMIALDKAPDWYITSLLTAISASFGIKGYNHYKANGRKAVATQALQDFGVKVVQKVTAGGAKTTTVDAGPDVVPNDKPVGDTSLWPDLGKK